MGNIIWPNMIWYSKYHYDSNVKGVTFFRVQTHNRYQGIILGMCPANERQRYNVTPSLIGWVHSQNDPWIPSGISASWASYMDCNSFKIHCKELVRRKFIESWKCELNDLDKNPILRMYKLIKTNFSMEPYLNLIKEAKYRRSLTKLRLSSHNLEIERGRHTKPVTPVIERLCIVCGVIDDELHFVTSCKKHTTERERLYSYVDSHVPNFCNLPVINWYIYEGSIVSNLEKINCFLTGPHCSISSLVRNHYLDQSGSGIIQEE